jgi:hypothetical protein
MAQIDIADAATAGVKFTLRRPLTVLVWGALVVVFLALLVGLFGGGIVTSIIALAQSPDASPRPEAILSLIGGFLGFFCLLFLGSMVLGAIVMAAALRAELEPEKTGLAYLRFGGQELWLIGVNFVMWVVLFVAQMVMSIPLVVLMVAMGAASFGMHPGGGPEAFTGAMASALGVRLIGQLVILAVTIWLWCRLSMGPVMSFRERQFRLFESWNLTRGHAWSIFLTLLLVFVMLIALEIVLYILGGLAMFAAIAPIPGITDPQTFFSRPPGEWIDQFAPAAAILALLVLILVGVGNAMTWIAVARLYRQIALPSEAPPAAVATGPG